jgi:hypothetical protein
MRLALRRAAHRRIGSGALPGLTPSRRRCRLQSSGFRSPPPGAEAGEGGAARRLRVRRAAPRGGPRVPFRGRAVAILRRAERWARPCRLRSDFAPPSFSLVWCCAV